MVVEAIDGGMGLLKADVVESCKRCSIDVRDLMVRYEEQLLWGPGRVGGVGEEIEAQSLV